MNDSANGLTSPDESPPTDERLLDAACHGNLASFEELVNRFQQRLFGLAFRLTNVRQDAEDVVQQTFLSLLESMESFRGESSVATWLLRIATNHALKVLRKRRGLPMALTSEVNGVDPEDDYAKLPHPEFIAEWREGPQEQLLKVEAGDALEQALAELDEKYRVVFLLRDVEGLSVRETARALDLTEGTVKVRLLRARLVLRERMTRIFGDESKRLFPDHEHG